MYDKKLIDSNREAWGTLSHDHYLAFRERFRRGEQFFNHYIEKELGDLSGKDVVHLQCNTGADTLLLARRARHVTGVDLVPGNIRFARQLAADLGADNADFIEADIMDVPDMDIGKFDVVFTSEGAIGWLPDLGRWGRAVRSLLKDGGRVYVFDSHPFLLMLDEAMLSRGEYGIKYPYFSKTPDEDTTIGGYATPEKSGVKCYFWMYTVGDIINALADAGMRIEFFHEFPELFFSLDAMQSSDKAGMYEYGFNRGHFPSSFSVSAVADK